MPDPTTYSPYPPSFPFYPPGQGPPPTGLPVRTVSFCSTPDRFATEEARWPLNHLTWNIQSGLPFIMLDAFRTAAAQAFGFWAEVANLKFTENLQAPAHILIGTGPIDGPNGVLAWSELPPANPCRQRYDTGETWRTSDGQGILLVAVMAHEIGHALGLDHAPKGADALLAPFYSPQIIKPRPHDITRIQALYGPPVSQPPVPPQPPLPPAPPAGPTTITINLPQPLAAGAHVFAKV